MIEKFPTPGSCVEVGGLTVISAHGMTVTVAAGLSTGVPHAPLTRTQYLVVSSGVTVSLFELVPTGLLVSPDSPRYHWYERVLPVAVTCSCVDWPSEMLVLAGGTVMAGSAQVAVTVAVLLSTVSASQVCPTRTQ